MLCLSAGIEYITQEKADGRSEDPSVLSDSEGGGGQGLQRETFLFIRLRVLGPLSTTELPPGERGGWTVHGPAIGECHLAPPGARELGTVPAALCG